MKNSDDRLISEAYEGIYKEGIIDRLKGIGSGVKAGLKTGVANAAGSVASKFGANVRKPTKTMGGEYAKAQQKSLYDSFVKKVGDEYDDFDNDINELGGDQFTPAQLKKKYPDVDTKIKSILDLLKVLKNPKKSMPTPPVPPTPTPTPVPPTPTSTPVSAAKAKAEADAVAAEKTAKDDTAKAKKAVAEAKADPTNVTKEKKATRLSAVAKNNRTLARNLRKVANGTP